MQVQLTISRERLCTADSKNSHEPVSTGYDILILVDCSLPVGRVSEGLAVANHARVEDNFARHGLVGSEGVAAVDLSVCQCESSSLVRMEKVVKNWFVAHFDCW